MRHPTSHAQPHTGIPPTPATIARRARKQPKRLHIASDVGWLCKRNIDERLNSIYAKCNENLPLRCPPGKISFYIIQFWALAPKLTFLKRSISMVQTQNTYSSRDMTRYGMVCEVVGLLIQLYLICSISQSSA